VKEINKQSNCNHLLSVGFIRKFGNVCKLHVRPERKKSTLVSGLFVSKKPQFLGLEEKLSSDLIGATDQLYNAK
jgi:hypothetical protein